MRAQRALLARSSPTKGDEASRPSPDGFAGIEVTRYAERCRSALSKICARYVEREIDQGEFALTSESRWSM